MAHRQAKPITITNLRGRDGSLTSSSQLPIDKAKEMLNVDLYRTTFARKRAGSSSLSLTFGSGGPFAGSGIFALGVGADSPVLWAGDVSQIAYKTISSTWVEPAIVEAPIPNFRTQFLAFDGRTYISSNLGASSRLMVYDGTSIRFTGMATPAAPSVANTGGGAYAATPRYYRVRYTVQSGGITLRRGEASTATSFTPSGAGTAARVTKPAATSPAEGETHWELEVSLDNAVWYLLATTAVGTTTYDDSAVTTTYLTNDVAPLAGAYTNWQDMTVIGSDVGRLLGAKNNTLYWSPVKGTTSASFLDAERVPDTTVQKNYKVIVGDGDDGNITGISVPFLNATWVFKATAIHRFTRTSDDTAAYQATQIYAGSGIGCIHQRTIVYGHDERGNQALYFLSARGPYRLSINGLQWLGEDIRDIWDTVTNPTSGFAHGCADPERHQIWWWVGTNGSSFVNTRLVFDTRLGTLTTDASGASVMSGGWTVHTGDAAQAWCSVTASIKHADATFGALDRLIPYFTLVSTFGNKIYYRDETVTSDAGTAFQALVTLPDRHYAGDDHALAITGASLVGTTGSHSLRLSLSGDYGAQTARTSDVTMTATGAATRRRATFEDAALSDSVSAAGVSIGDSAAVASSWTIDSLRLLVEQRESLLP